MAKALRTASIIVGAVVAVAAAIPTGGGSTLLAASLGVGVGTASAIAGGVAVLTSTITALSGKNPAALPIGSPFTFTPCQGCIP